MYNNIYMYMCIYTYSPERGAAVAILRATPTLALPTKLVREGAAGLKKIYNNSKGFTRYMYLRLAHPLG